MVRNIVITKKFRDSPIPDKPINFSPLENLYLELLENKKKIKPGLPLIPTQIKRPSRPKISTSPNSNIKDSLKISESEKKEPEPQKKKPEDNGDARLFEELGEVSPVDLDKIHLGEDKKETVKDEEGGVIEGELEKDEDIEEEEDDIYAGLSHEEREEKEKEEYIWRFRILKKKYKSPQISIPIFNEHSDLQMMKTAYNRTIRELYLDDAVETYRTYLVGGFILMEFVCIQWVGIDLSGFTLQQTRIMYKYDRLLIELGEKSYNRWGMNLPVEIRLIGFIILQAGIFYLGKIISDKFGNSVAELFKGITGQPPDQVASTSQTSSTAKQNPPKKKRMRGPKIRPEDIRNMTPGAR